MSRSDILSLFVMIDALGSELVQRHGFLDDVLRTRGEVETIFGYSSTCHPTILTGTLPREHGHFAFYRYDPSASPFTGVYEWLRHLPRKVTSRGRVRAWMSRAVEWMTGFTGYFQLYNMPFEHLSLFDYSEKRDLYRPGGINGGQTTIFDDLEAAGIPFYLSDWRASEDVNFASLERELRAQRPRFAYLYLGGLDGVLHAHGTEDLRSVAKLRDYEARIRKVLEIADAGYREVRFHVFSDHGMTDTRDTCHLQERLEGLGLRFGKDYAAVYDSTMARFWFLRPGARELVTQALREEPRGRILDDATLTRWGCDFPGQHYGELFFLMDPGVLLCPSFMGETALAGMHGYSPEDPHSRALYASNVPRAQIPPRLDAMRSLMFQEAELRPRDEDHDHEHDDSCGHHCCRELHGIR